MAETNPTKANNDLWTAYLSSEWDSWTRTSRIDSTRAARWTAAVIAAAWAPWLTFLTWTQSPEDVR